MGRPEFSQPGTQGGGQTVAVNNRPNIVKKSLTQTDTVAAGGSELVEVYAPAGSVYTLKQIQLDVAGIGSATQSDHRFLLESAGHVYAVEASSSYADKLTVWKGSYQNATNLKRPDSDAALVQQIQSMQATENQPIRVNYLNRTDADQTDQRDINMVLEKSEY